MKGFGPNLENWAIFGLWEIILEFGLLVNWIGPWPWDRLGKGSKGL